MVSLCIYVIFNGYKLKIVYYMYVKYFIVWGMLVLMIV